MSADVVLRKLLEYYLKEIMKDRSSNQNNLMIARFSSMPMRIHDANFSGFHHVSINFWPYLRTNL